MTTENVRNTPRTMINQFLQHHHSSMSSLRSGLRNRPPPTSFGDNPLAVSQRHAGKKRTEQKTTESTHLSSSELTPHNAIDQFLQIAKTTQPVRRKRAASAQTPVVDRDANNSTTLSSHRITSVNRLQSAAIQVHKPTPRSMISAFVHQGVEETPVTGTHHASISYHDSTVISDSAPKRTRKSIREESFLEDLSLQPEDVRQVEPKLKRSQKKRPQITAFDVTSKMVIESFGKDTAGRTMVVTAEVHRAENSLRGEGDATEETNTDASSDRQTVSPIGNKENNKCKSSVIKLYRASQRSTQPETLSTSSVTLRTSMLSRTSSPGDPLSPRHSIPLRMSRRSPSTSAARRSASSKKESLSSRRTSVTRRETSLSPRQMPLSPKQSTSLKRQQTLSSPRQTPLSPRQTLSMRHMHLSPRQTLSSPSKMSLSARQTRLSPRKTKSLSSRQMQLSPKQILSQMQMSPSSRQTMLSQRQTSVSPPHSPSSALVRPMSQWQTSVSTKQSSLSQRQTPASSRQTPLSQKQSVLAQRQQSLSSRLPTLPRRQLSLSPRQASLSMRHTPLSARQTSLPPKAALKKTPTSMSKKSLSKKSSPKRSMSMQSLSARQTSLSPKAALKKTPTSLSKKSLSKKSSPKRAMSTQSLPARCMTLRQTSLSPRQKSLSPRQISLSPRQMSQKQILLSSNSALKKTPTSVSKKSVSKMSVSVTTEGSTVVPRDTSKQDDMSQDSEDEPEEGEEEMGNNKDETNYNNSLLSYFQRQTQLDNSVDTAAGMTGGGATVGDSGIGDVSRGDRQTTTAYKSCMLGTIYEVGKGKPMMQNLWSPDHTNSSMKSRKQTRVKVTHSEPWLWEKKKPPTVSRKIVAPDSPVIHTGQQKQRRKTDPPFPRLPTSLTRSIFTHFTRCGHISHATMDEVEKVADIYWKNAVTDLAAYVKHASRGSVLEADVELLMKRQRFVTKKTTMYTLVEKYLSLEHRQKVIPIARSGNQVVPKH